MNSDKTHIALLFVLLLSFATGTVFSQKTSAQISRAHRLLQISDSLYQTGNFRAMAYYDSLALQIGLAEKNALVKGKSYYQKGKYFLEKARYQQAIEAYKNALHSYFENERNATTATIYNDIAFTEGELGKYDIQVNWYLKAIRLFEKLNNETGLAQAYSNISKAYFEIENDSLAFEYAQKSLTIRNKLDNPNDLAISYCNIANMYATLNKTAEANKYLDIGMKYAAQSNNKDRLAQAYITKSLLLNSEKKIKEALEYEKKSIAIYEELEDLGMVASRSIAAAFYSNALQDTATAHFYFTMAEKLASSVGNKVVLRNVYSYVSDFHKGHKNFRKAFEYQQEFYKIRDSILNGETVAKIADLQAAYNVEKKDFEINKLQIEQKIKNLEIEKQKAIIAGNFAEAQQKKDKIDLLFKTQLLQEESLKRQQKELDYQKLKATSNQQQLEIANQSKELQEKQLGNQKGFRNLLIGVLLLVLLLGASFINRLKLKKKIDEQASLLKIRNTISENLHDDIGASLSNINMLNQLAKNNMENKPKLQEYLHKAGEDIQSVSESISDIVWNINPKYDSLDNLFIKMKRYAADMMDGKNIDYEIDFAEDIDDVTLDMEKRKNLYLYFKEAINNLTKYSQAKHAKMSLRREKNSFLLQISDDGIGFDTDKRPAGNGIHNMKKRAEELRGKMDVRTSIGSGTFITLHFPIT